jgi:hypothetical protein
MSYMTMEEQLTSHLAFLTAQDAVVKELHIDRGFIRCNTRGETEGRGELCYQTKMTQLNKGLIGLATWFRGKGGQVKTHKTYGLPCSNLPSSNAKDLPIPINRLEAVKKAEIFWQMSDEIGEAEYLLRKGVGYYGIRFRQTDYGKVAVIPMGDVTGKLYGYQLINADGSKRFAKEISTIGLLHMLHRPINGLQIGLAESYVTAASCFEVTGMAMVTSFSGGNLKNVGVELRKQFPQSPLIIFGDDDRHLQENKGRQAALAAEEVIGIACKIVIPNFEGYPPLREFSDWNDFVREKGVKATRDAIQTALKRK